MLEGDVLEVIQSIWDLEADLSYNGTILLDIFYSGWFDRFGTSFVPKVCNQVTNLLAHHAKHNASYMWVEEPPNFAVQCLKFNSAI